jgi:hypothetical protein
MYKRWIYRDNFRCYNFKLDITVSQMEDPEISIETT